MSEAGTPINVGKDKSLDCPGIFANRFQVAVMQAGLVRLGFGEGYGGQDAEIHWRGVVVAHSADMQQLLLVLTEALKTLNQEAKP